MNSFIQLETSPDGTRLMVTSSTSGRDGDEEIEYERMTFAPLISTSMVTNWPGR